MRDWIVWLLIVVFMGFVFALLDLSSYLDKVRDKQNFHYTYMQDMECYVNIGRKYELVVVDNVIRMDRRSSFKPKDFSAVVADSLGNRYIVEYKDCEYNNGQQDIGGDPSTYAKIEEIITND